MEGTPNDCRGEGGICRCCELAEAEVGVTEPGAVVIIPVPVGVSGTVEIVGAMDGRGATPTTADVNGRGFESGAATALDGVAGVLLSPVPVAAEPNVGELVDRPTTPLFAISLAVPVSIGLIVSADGERLKRVTIGGGGARDFESF